MDCLKGENPDENLLWHWEAYAGDYRRAKAPLRAALMNGFEAARSLGRAHEDIQTKMSDRVTRSESDVRTPLIALARSMTWEERVHVAQVDRGCDAARHLDALSVVLARADCLYPDGEVWFPAEVIELVSHDPVSVGFLPATALLLVNAISARDHVENASFRWSRLGPGYRDLPQAARGVILAGFRHLYETDVDWLGLEYGSRDRTCSIPWVALDPVPDF